MRRRAIDLFAGAGGASLGLHWAGYDVMGYEIWNEAVITHRMNRLPCQQLDLKADGSWVNDGTIDVVWGSPPCQPFSQNNKVRINDLDPRDCIPDFIRITTQLMPRLVVMENVQGLLYPKNTEYVRMIRRSFHRLGYKVGMRTLNSANYGTPQTRKRSIFIARMDRAPKWPLPTHGTPERPYVSMEEALGWEGVPLALNTGRDWKKGEDRSKAQTIPITRPAPTITTCVGIMWWVPTGEKPARYDPLRGYPNPLGSSYLGGTPHPTVRGHQLTIGELTTLMGFPPRYAFSGNKTDQAKQIGNAVPPQLAHAIVKANRPRRTT